jgi:spermidine synthase
VLLRGRRRALFLFAALQTGVAVGFAVSAALFPHLRTASSTVLGTEIVGSFRDSVLTMFIRAALILFPAAVCLGATLPLATEFCVRGLARLGGAVGRVYAVNTVGCILGSLGAGFVLIPLIGMQGTLLLLISTNLALALLLAASEAAPARQRLTVAAVVLATGAALLSILPSDVFRRTFGQPGQEIIFYKEGATDTVAVAESYGQRAILYDDQRGTAGTGSFRENFMFGHLPMLLHPGEPRRVLHICFGVGNSLSAVAAHESLERVDNVELSPHVLDAAHFFWTNNGVLSSPKVRTIIDDGRNYVMATREQYDVILLEPPEMFTAGVINLYTREFYEDAAAHLAPDGLMMQWLPFAEAPLEAERMFFRSFYDVFPNATAWKQLEGGPVLMIGTTQPLTIDYQRLKARMREPRVYRDLELIGVADVDHLLALFVFDNDAFRDFALGAPPITDDQTVLDFSMPRYIGTGFGLGTFNRNVLQDGQGPFGAIMRRGQYYFDHRSSVIPLLTNLAGEDPANISARINARARPLLPPQPFIAQSNWRR